MFAERLKKLREEKSISQKTLSDLLGISQSTYALYETGKREPNFATLIKISEYFNCTVDYLIGISENKIIENENIGKRLGLSDRAIDILEYQHNYFPFDKTYINVLNFLLEEYEDENTEESFDTTLQKIVDYIGYDRGAIWNDKTIVERDDEIRLLLLRDALRHAHSKYISSRRGGDENGKETDT